jgi:hypothetical protein
MSCEYSYISSSALATGGGLDMRKEQMSRHLIHRERPKRSQRERPVDRTLLATRRTAPLCRAHCSVQSAVSCTPHDARIIIAPSGGIVLHPRPY